LILMQANAIGRSAKTVREYLEKHYSEEQVSTEQGTVKLALRALMEVVQSGAKNVEFAIMKRGERLKVSAPESSNGCQFLNHGHTLFTGPA